MTDPCAYQIAHENAALAAADIHEDWIDRDAVHADELSRIPADLRPCGRCSMCCPPPPPWAVETEHLGA